MEMDPATRYMHRRITASNVEDAILIFHDFLNDIINLLF